MPPPVSLRSPASPKFVLARNALRANGGGALTDRLYPTASRRSASTTTRRMGTGGLASGTGRTRAAYVAT
jgi:hypothetical protein